MECPTYKAAFIGGIVGGAMPVTGVSRGHPGFTKGQHGVLIIR